MAGTPKNQSSSSFAGGGVFTADNPKAVLGLENKPAWVALEVDEGGNLRGGVGKDFVDQLKAQGIKVYIWAPGYNGTETVEGVMKINDSAISAANNTGANGVIFQGETPEEVQAAFAAVGKTSLQTAIVGDGTSIATNGWVNPNTTFLVEAYSNANPYATVSVAVANAQRTGATDVVPIYGYYDDRGVHATVPVGNYVQQAQQLGINNYGIFSIESLAGNSSDMATYSNSFGQKGTDKPVPQLYNPAQADPKNPFSGVGAFTASSPAYSLWLGGTLNWVGVKAGGADGVGSPDNPASIIPQIKNVGLNVIIWATPVPGDAAGQLAANQAAIKLAEQYGAAGVVFPATDAAELQAAQTAGGQTSLPQAILSGVNTVGQTASWNGSIFLLGDNMTPEQLAAAAAANPKIVPIIPTYGATADGGMMPTYLSDFQNKGINNFGIFTLESLGNSGSNVQSYFTYLAKKAQGALPPPVGGGAAGAAAGATGSSGQSHQKPKKKTTAAKKKDDNNLPAIGINGPHYEPGTHGAPPLHTAPGNAPPIKDKSFSFKDKHGRMVTITTTASGAKVEQVAGHSAYQVAKAGTVNIPTPEWHPTLAQNATKKTGMAPVDAHGSVLAQRDSKDGTSLILQMSDGKYISVNKTTNAVTPAGFWGDGTGGGVAKNGIGASGAPPVTPTAATTSTPSAAANGTRASAVTTSTKKPSVVASTQVANTNKSGFPDKYVYSTGDPNGVSAIPAGVGIAIKVGGSDGATQAQIEAFKAAHPNNPVVIWVAPVEGESAATTYQNAANVANSVGAAGFLAQGEDAGQMHAAASVTGVNVPKAIVTNGDKGVAWPPGWGMAAEWYDNDPGAGVDVTTLAKWIQSTVAAGATSVQVTIGSYSGMYISMDTYQKAIDYLKSQGIDVSSVSMYIWDGSTPEQQSAFVGLSTGGTVTTTTTTTTTTSGGGTTTTKPPTTKPKPKHKPTETGNDLHPEKKETLGIQHEKRLDEVDSHGYKGEKDPRLTYSYTDKTNKDNTLTFRPNGMVIQTKEDGSSFVVWDPSKHNGQKWPGFKNQDIKDPYEGATINEDAHTKVAAGTLTPSGAATPAWHVNPGWKGLDATTQDALKRVNGIDPSQVLEEREGANSEIVIFRMADGTYKSLDTNTGEVKGAGTWNNTQWNSTGYGPKITGGGAAAAASGGSSGGGGSGNSSGSGGGSSSNSSGGNSSSSFSTVNPNNGKTVYNNVDPAVANVGEGIHGHGTALAMVAGKKDNWLVQMSDGTIQSVSKEPGKGGATGAGTWGRGDGTGTSAMTNVTVGDPTTVEKNNAPPTYPPASAIPLKDPYASMPLDAINGTVSSTGGSCFPAGSKILMPHGHKNIEDIKLGDKVLTWNFDESRMDETKVTDVLAHHARETIVIKTTKGDVTTTEEHPFWNGDKWVAAGKLKAGDSVIYHQIGELAEITAVEKGEKHDVYNFHVVSPAHNYFVDGFLVHNMKMIN